MARGQQQPSGQLSPEVHRVLSGLASRSNSSADSVADALQKLSEKGVDLSTVQIKPMHGKVHALLRAHTIPLGCMSLEDTGLDFEKWNRDWYEPWLARSYGRDAKPWYDAPSAVFVKYAEGETGRALIQQKYEVARRLVTMLNNLLDGEDGAARFAVFHQYETILSQAEREDAVLRTFKRPLDAATKFDTTYKRDDCPELTLERMTTGTNFRDLCLSLLPHEESSHPFSVVRSPGGVFERLQDPNSAPGPSTRMTGVTAGIRIWYEDGMAARHVALLTFCVHLIMTIFGAKEEDLETQGIQKVHIKRDVRDTLSKASVAGHEGAPPRHRPDAFKSCVNCGNVETDKKFTCCGSCKAKVGRYHYYCSRECQVADWKVQHKAICGRPLADSQAFESAAAQRSELDEVRKLWTKQVSQLPRCVFYRPSAEGPHDWTSWDVPNFVRPFRLTVAKLKEIVGKALDTKDGVSIGILMAFLRLASPYTGGDGHATAEETESMLCRVFDVSQDELSEMEKAAEREIQQREEYALVKSCFEQIKTETPDTSFPDLTIPPSALFMYDALEVYPTTFFAINMSPEVFPLKDEGGPHSRVRASELPRSVKPYEATLAAVRALAFRVLEEGGRDRLNVGMLNALYCADSRVKFAKHYLNKWEPCVCDPHPAFDRFCASVFEWPAKKAAAARRLAMARMDDLREDDEWKLIIGAIEQLDEQSGAAYPDLEEYSDDDENGKVVTSSKKKRNKKKKKAKKAPVAEDGDAAGEAGEGVEARKDE
ncbi:hypothetical protein JCM6882_009427 [Rhodosporidiobolus microsporus]